jgi:magnesium transporter
MTGDEATPSAQLIPETAEFFATRNIPFGSSTDQAGAVRENLAEKRFESAADLAVIEGERLVGLVRLEALLAAPSETPLAEIMDADPPVVAPGLDQEIAAWRAVQRAESSLAVLDDENRFIGLIPPHRLLGVLLHEHDEDMARLGGYLRGTAAAREASEERISRRYIHRMPWLLVGLAGALVAAGIVGSFEHQLEETVTIAFFMPGIVYLADAVGTQTETIVIRGLSVGVRVPRVVRREVVTGVLVGATLGLAFVPVGLVAWGDTDVVLAVALSLFLACSIATAIALSLPWAFQRMGIDPAYGSGPLATVVQDLLSITVYLLVSQAIVG